VESYHGQKFDYLSHATMA